MMEQTRCPLCGQEMEAGWLAAGGQPIKWAQKGRSFIGSAMAEGVRLLRGNTVRALLCRGCRKVFAHTLGG